MRAYTYRFEIRPLFTVDKINRSDMKKLIGEIYINKGIQVV